MSASDSPSQVLDRFYTAERAYMSAPAGSKDSSGMVACLAPTFTLYQSPDLPWGGDHKGLDGFLKWGEIMAQRFDVLDVQNPKVFESGDTVLVYSTLHLRVAKTGKDWVQPLVQHVKVEDGLITEIRPFYWDVQGLNDLLGE